VPSAAGLKAPPGARPQGGQEMLGVEAAMLPGYRFPAADLRLVERLAGG